MHLSSLAEQHYQNLSPVYSEIYHSQYPTRDTLMHFLKQTAQDEHYVP